MPSSGPRTGREEIRGPDDGSLLAGLFGESAGLIGASRPEPDGGGIAAPRGAAARLAASAARRGQGPEAGGAGGVTAAIAERLL